MVWVQKKILSRKKCWKVEKVEEKLTIGLGVGVGPNMSWDDSSAGNRQAGENGDLRRVKLAGSWEDRRNLQRISFLV